MESSVATAPLESGCRPREVVVLVCALAGRTPICRRIGFQALALDRLSAAHADAVRAQRYALQRTLDIADLLHIARDFRQIDIDQEVGEGLVLEIADAAGDIGVAFIFGPNQRFPGLVPQFAPSVAQLVLEARVFAASGRGTGSSGIVCLGCHANVQQPECPCRLSRLPMPPVPPGLADRIGAQFASLQPEEYRSRYFAPGRYSGRTRGDDTGERFVTPEAKGGEARRQSDQGPQGVGPDLGQAREEVRGIIAECHRS